MTNDQILDSLEDERERFLDSIDGLSDEEMQVPGVIGDWSVKDIMSHLIAWEAELVKLLWQAKQGQKPSSAHFAKTTVDELNELWHTETKSRTLDRVMADFNAVRKQTNRRVEAFTDKDLNDGQRYPWLEDRPLWKWIAVDSFEHEAEHREQIRKWRASQGL